jgi:hypothetical protein
MRRLCLASFVVKSFDAEDETRASDDGRRRPTCTVDLEGTVRSSPKLISQPATSCSGGLDFGGMRPCLASLFLRTELTR